MTFLASIEHDQQEFAAYRGEPYQLATQPARTTSRRDEIGRLAYATMDQTVARAKRAAELKRRLYLRIPYHEWADALARGRCHPDELLDAYASVLDWKSGQSRPGVRCPPWATKRYRECPACR